MDKSRQPAKNPRDLVRDARRAASMNDVDRAICLYDECIREYMNKKNHFKALAISRKAKSVLGRIPKVSSLIIRSYLAAGLTGDAQQEYESAASQLRKESLKFFMALDKEAFIDLLGIMDITAYPKGRVVLKRGDTDMDVFIVITGSCGVYRDDTKLGDMLPGDVFGEIGFFARTARSATVKTLERSVLVKIASEPLRHLKDRHENLRQILESVYSERILKKVAEDLEGGGILPFPAEVTAMLRYEKGQDIPKNPEDSLAILKHGIVEIDYDEMLLKKKQYLKPGSVISGNRIRARASTDVVIMLTKIPEL